MATPQVYSIILYIFTAVAVLIFISLFFFTAPYGRHASSGWGPLIDNRIGWMLQEAPSSLMMFYYLATSGRNLTSALIVLFIMWQCHYFHRTFIYPFTIRSSNKMPVSIVFTAVIFNMINSYVQGMWLFTLSPPSMYTDAWLLDPRFFVGAMLFTIGYIINKHSDYILRNLRKEGDSNYYIPEGGLFRYITSPNYFGELLTWTGWAVATWSLAGVFFLIWTFANLVPRARSHHRWYHEKFEHYPRERKILIPFLY